MVDRSSPRIGCVADYPLKLRIQALEFVNLSPRDPPTPSVSDLPSLLSSTTTLCGKCDLRFTFLQVTITSQHHFDFSLFFLCCLVLFQYHLRPSWIHFSYFFTCEGLKCMTKFSIPTVQYKHGIMYVYPESNKLGCQGIQNLMEILFIGIVCNVMQKSKYILFFNSAQLCPVSFFNSDSIIFCTCVASLQILASAYIFESMI